MPELVEHAEHIEIRSPMHRGLRLAFALLALFPLLAPYELLLRIDWQYYLHPFFFLSLFISAGAVALSLFLVFAAAAGLSSRMVFDATRKTFTYSSQAPLLRIATSTYPMTALKRIDVKSREWSDSAPTHHLCVLTSDGKEFESGSSWSRNEIEDIRSRVDMFLRRAMEEWPPPNPSLQRTQNPHG
jgi:hypothetical protein